MLSDTTGAQRIGDIDGLEARLDSCDLARQHAVAAVEDPAVRIELDRLAEPVLLDVGGERVQLVRRDDRQHVRRRVDLDACDLHAALRSLALSPPPAPRPRASICERRTWRPRGYGPYIGSWSTRELPRRVVSEPAAVRVACAAP